MNRTSRMVTAVGGGAVCVSLLSGCGLLPFGKELTDDATVASVRTVRVDNGPGNVTIRADPSATGTAVHRVVTYRADAPGPSHRVEGDTLVLAGCGRNCSVDYTVVVPTGTVVTGRMASGDAELAGLASATLSVGLGNLRARDVTGPLDVTVESGDVTATNIARAAAVRSSSGNVSLDAVGGDVTVRARSGDVTGSGLAGKVDVEDNFGNVRVDVAQPRDVRVKADSGDIRVSVPRGPYRVTATTRSGTVEAGVANDQAARQLLELHTASGNVTTRYR